MLTALTHANIVAITARRLARTPTRLVITEHLGPTTWAADAGAAHTLLMTTLMRMTYRSADGIVAVSNGVAHDVAKTAGLPVERISVISNPVILSALEERAEEPVDDPWVGPDEPPLVLAVGRLTPQKDFATLIRAVARVRRSMPCRLLVLGQGEERAALERLAADLGIADDVRFPGFVANPYPYFPRAAVLALSSRFEGLPTVLLEAVCLQVPVVATDCPSGPREILDDGRYGRLVPPGDVEALADAILRTLKDEGPRPPAEACERYRLDSVVDQYAAAVGALAPRRPGGRHAAQAVKYPVLQERRGRRLVRQAAREAAWIRRRGLRQWAEEARLDVGERATTAVAKWRWRRRHSVASNAVPVWLVGVQRSGTTMFARRLGALPAVELHNETSSRAFHRFQLLPDETLRRLVTESGHAVVVFKALCDSQRARELLDGLATPSAGRAIWLYRSCDDRARSSLAKFGPRRPLGAARDGRGPGGQPLAGPRPFRGEPRLHPLARLVARQPRDGVRSLLVCPQPALLRAGTRRAGRRPSPLLRPSPRRSGDRHAPGLRVPRARL